jgi:nitrate/TMAO reductase-like tetraheme cytochrome c subunit
MTCWQRWGLAAVMVGLAWGTVAAEPTPVGEGLPVAADWRARAMNYFESADPKAQRREMRKATRALKRPCRYCHTPDFKDYTPKRRVAQQMMALSVENSVDCADCHVGKAGFTELGQKSQPMWEVAREKGVFCDACHQPKAKFTELTTEGQRYQANKKANKKANKRANKKAKEKVP